MACCRTSRRTSGVGYGDRGQASIEAAALLGVVMLLLALLAQPVCLMYTKAIMSHVAAQAARVLATTNDPATVRSFVLRRLEAVPYASPFHVGGEQDWSIDLALEDAGKVANVQIAGHARPLPLFGAITTMAAEKDEVGVIVRVKLRVTVRPTWLEGDYGSWVMAWR